MLKNIKLSYIARIVFSFVEEKQKLKIIKINKSLQKIIHINIINYKHFKGKYIIYESDEYGKEYNGYDDKLLFEGEYYHGERNGNGKEFSAELYLKANIIMAKEMDMEKNMIIMAKLYMKVNI